MSVSCQATLTLPNDPRFLRVARACVEQLAALAELPEDAAGPLVEAAVEACANVLDHAFEPGEPAEYTLAGEVTPTDLVLSIRDRGLPFDPHRAGPDDSRARVSASGGLARIREAVDRAEWLHHGRQGKELRLVKHRPQLDVTEQVPADQLERVAEDAPLAPEQDYTIRRFRPEDAAGISRCIYRVYGNTYLHEDAYYPDRIVQHNASGEWASIVAESASGEIVGHYALERPKLALVAERGIAVVSPEHRGRDLMGRMRIALEDEARRLGLIGVFSYAVTKHVFSQRVNESFGSDVCGIALGGGTSHQVFRRIASEDEPQRVSWVFYFTYVKRPERSVAYAPEGHRSILEPIYARLELPVEFREGARPEGDSELEVSYSHSTDSGIIRVLQVGEDTGAEIRRARRDLCGVAGAEVIYLELPLAQPGTSELCRQAEEDGFFFSALAPSLLPDGDALVLQFLNVPLDTDELKIASPIAQELLRYIERERAERRSPAPSGP